jgi:hypothetical protein
MNYENTSDLLISLCETLLAVLKGMKRIRTIIKKKAKKMPQ